MKQFDLAVIGSGSGLIVMEKALQLGLKVAVIERSNFGGTCLNRGCIPSKMLVYPADLVRDAQMGKRVGISYGAPAIDWETITRNMREQIDEIAAGIEEMERENGERFTIKRMEATRKLAAERAVRLEREAKEKAEAAARRKAERAAAKRAEAAAKAVADSVVTETAE